MSSYPRLLLFTLGLFQAVFAVGFFVRAPFALAFWPWGATSGLSYIFIASILAAARSDGALSGIALDYVVIFAPMAVYTFSTFASAARERMPATLPSARRATPVHPWEVITTRPMPKRGQ